MSEKVNYRPDIDGLRALAVVPVVLFHLGVAGFAGGFLGVDVFFVISGYLIGGLVHRELLAGDFSIIRFYERRARRILPAIVVVTAATLIAGWMLLYPWDFVIMARSSLATMLVSSNVYFWKFFDYFAPSAELQPLLHTWSLSVEEQFYLVFPLTMALVVRWRPKMVTPFVAAAAALSLAAAMVVAVDDPNSVFYLIPFRAWELALGVLVAVSGFAPSSRRRSEIYATIGAVLVLAPIPTAFVPGDVPGLVPLLPCLGTAMLLAAGTSHETRVSGILTWPFMRFIGLISYSLYLWHWPLIAFARVVVGSTELPATWQIAIGALSFALAAASWRWVEQPFRNRGWLSRPAVFSLSVVSIAGLSLLSGAVLLNDGFRGRFPQSEYAGVGMTDEDLDEEAAWKACSDRTPSEGLCTHGTDRSKPGVLLWGDSHAGTAWAGLKAASEVAGRRAILAIHPACLPSLGLYQVDSGTRKRCLGVGPDLVSFLESDSADVETVILHARWAMYFRHGTEDAGLDRMPMAAPKPDGESDGSVDAVASGLDSLVARLKSIPVEVILVGDVPEIGFSARQAALRRYRFGDPLPEAPMLSDVRRQAAIADSVLGATAHRRSATWLDLAPGLCKPTCPVENDGGLLYGNHHHLTAHGSRSLLTPVFSHLLSDRSLVTPP